MGSKHEYTKRLADEIKDRGTLRNALGEIVAGDSLTMLTTAAQQTGNTAPWGEEQKQELFEAAIDLASQNPKSESLVGLMLHEKELPPERREQLHTVLDVTWQGLYIGRAA